ncbi:MAG: hypothetical protein NT001_01505, partial [Candidatus Woesearchaeota archaeon]|nr:hypothetical protein [Candidatus Woesearchaeota archaeon]
MNTNDIRQFYNAVDLDGTWGLKDASMESYLKFLGLMALSIPGYTGIKADVPESKSKEAYSSLKENLVSLCQDITNPKERNYLLTQVIPLGFDAGTDQKIVQLAQQSGDGLSAEQRIAIRNEVDFYHYNRHFLPYNQPEIVAMVRSLRKNLADMGQDYNKPLSEIVEEFRKEQGKFYPAIKKIDPSNMFYRDGQVLDCHYLFIKDSAGQVLYNVVRAGTPEGAKAALEAIRDMDPDLRLDCVSGCMPALRREKETADKLMEVWSELNGQITSKPEIIDKMGYLPFDNRLTQRLIESRANSEYEECHGENGTITRLTRMNKSRKR